MKAIFSNLANWRGMFRKKDHSQTFEIFPDDVFLVGYPKSGNTWLDFLVACLRTSKPEDINFDTLEKYVADTYYNNATTLKQLAKPRFLKSHEPFDSRYPKVVYIVRDPRAVAISYYHHLVRLKVISPDFSISQFIPQFIEGKMDKFGTWGEHVHSWFDARNQFPDRVMAVSYEDMKVATHSTLSQVATYLGIDSSTDRIREAISWASPDNMRRLEIDPLRSPGRGASASREGNYFVRSANSDSWKQELDATSIELIEDAWGGIMQELGYVLQN